MAGAVAVAVAVAVVTLLGAVGELPAALGARTTQNTIRYLADDRFPGWKGEVATIGARSAQDGSAVRSGLAVSCSVCVVSQGHGGRGGVASG